MGITIAVFKRVGYISEQKKRSLIFFFCGNLKYWVGELEADFFNNTMPLTPFHVFFIEIHFCRSGIIHGVSFYLSLYLLTFLEEVRMLIKSFYESKKFVKSG